MFQIQRLRVECFNLNSAVSESVRFEVVVSDLGSADLAQPEQRARRALLPNATTVDACTPEYRAPDLFLGNTRFGTELDLWSAGCVAAEIWLGGQILFDQRDDMAIPRAHVVFLGEPEGEARDWLAGLPLWSKHFRGCPLWNQAAGQTGASRCRRQAGSFCGQSNRMMTQDDPAFRAIPEPAKDLVLRLLRWAPQERLTAESALRLPIFDPPPLALSVSKARGKHGSGSMASGNIQDELLEYLQEDPDWEILRAKAERTHFGPHCRCMSDEEGARMLKAEFPGYVDTQRPPKCLCLNSDKDLKPIAPRRLRQFGKALRRRAQLWLKELSKKIHKALRAGKVPARDLANGRPFLDEDFADNALVYASAQILKVGARDDGWHTDGGASLLHAGLTLFGSRFLDVDVGEGRERCISLLQEPGSFYIGNLCALDHDARHVENPAGCWGDGPDRLQIAVMFRSDVFRESRFRRKPGESELFDVVNEVTATHLAEKPFFLPVLSEVLDESP